MIRRFSVFCASDMNELSNNQKLRNNIARFLMQIVQISQISSYRYLKILQFTRLQALWNIIDLLFFSSHYFAFNCPSSFQLSKSETASNSNWNITFPSGEKLTLDGISVSSPASCVAPHVSFERNSPRQQRRANFSADKTIKVSSGIHKWRLGTLETLAEFPSGETPRPRYVFCPDPWIPSQRMVPTSPQDCRTLVKLPVTKSAASCHNICSRAANSTHRRIFYIIARINIWIRAIARKTCC